MANSQSRSLLAIAVHVALGSSLTALASEPVKQEEKVTELGKIDVDAEVSPYKAELASSPKYTELLRDKETTDAVLNEITLDLRWKVGTRLFQPAHDFKTTIICQCFNDLC